MTSHAPTPSLCTCARCELVSVSSITPLVPADTRSHTLASTIYDVASHILGAFDKSLQQYAEDKYTRRGIAIKGNRHVTAVHEGALDIKEEGRVHAGLMVWNTGLAPNPLIDSIDDLEKDPKTHSLQISETFNPRTREGKVLSDVFCIGDASALENKLPATAQGTSPLRLLLTYPLPR